MLHRVATTYPHRFLLADEVGLGKTIEAGLILKELKARGVANRVLVLAPSGIVRQWQFELRTKFNEIFAQLQQGDGHGTRGEESRRERLDLHDNVIASTSYACVGRRRRAQIALADWDLVIIDEAHHARRTREGRPISLARTCTDSPRRWPIQNSGTSRGCLLLTATPMQLDPFELYSLIELLDPTLFPDERTSRSTEASSRA